MTKAIIVTCFLLTAYLTHAQQISWYKCLVGKIGKYPITMHLHKKGHAYLGWYYYNNEQRPVELRGDDTGKKSVITLYAFPDDYRDGDDEKFEFSQAGDSFAGTWELNDKSTPLIFSASLKQDAGLLSFQFVYTSGSKKLRPAMKNSPEVSFEDATIWPAGTLPVEDTIRKILYGKNSIKRPGVGDILLERKKDFFDAYFSDMDSIDEAQMKQFPRASSRETVTSNTVVYQSQNLITIAQAGYYYDGGMHGMHGTGYTCINRIINKKLALDDVLTVNGKTMLQNLLEKHFRIDKHLAAGIPVTEGGLFKDAIEPNEDNFFVTGKGIGFYYTPYEIGPYSMGQITIFIPYSELNTGLQEEFKKLIQ